MNDILLDDEVPVCPSCYKKYKHSYRRYYSTSVVMHWICFECMIWGYWVKISRVSKFKKRVQCKIEKHEGTWKIIATGHVLDPVDKEQLEIKWQDHVDELVRREIVGDG